MKLYPLNLDIENKSCVVIGGGEVALRKIRGLLAAGAIVKVIAPEICAGVEELFKREEISLVREKFSESMLGDEIILIAATDNSEVNRQATRAAMDKKMLVNVVDKEGGNFNVPSQIRRGELLLTISTGATSPAFSKFVREMLESELDENFGTGLKIISEYRREVKRLLPNHKARKIFWEKFLTREVWEILKAGELDKLEERINHALKSFGIESQNSPD
ncbi:MAG: bifunctional precorrin-2 dehydrogenase/sirohydrochlorin ferrochelatase [Selenomonadaceae bacterium]|nr:bifunctional precorrin-2 dehydrogenase/sirohydrochlorin ferrochelatase [Selenomonadaceae bacterium]